MQSIQLIRDNLKRSETIVLSRVEEMQDYCVVPPTHRGGCHTLWVLGHLAYIESLVIRHFMLGEANPLADWQDRFDGEDVSQEIQDFPPFAQVLEQCRSTRASTIALLNTLEENDLDLASRCVPEGADDLFGTYRQCFQSAADHWFMHRGQLADARRAAGLTRMWY